MKESTTSSSNGLIEPFPSYNINMTPSSGNLVFVTFSSLRIVKSTKVHTVNYIEEFQNKNSGRCGSGDTLISNKKFSKLKKIMQRKPIEYTGGADK